MTDEDIVQRLRDEVRLYLDAAREIERLRTADCEWQAADRLELAWLNAPIEQQGEAHLAYVNHLVAMHSRRIGRKAGTKQPWRQR